jgi:hypothetical protein
MFNLPLELMRNSLAEKFNDCMDSLIFHLSELDGSAALEKEIKALQAKIGLKLIKFICRGARGFDRGTEKKAFHFS